MCIGKTAEVLELQEQSGITTCRVRFSDGHEAACLSYLDDLSPGDLVLVSGGAVVDRLEAAGCGAGEPAGEASSAVSDQEVEA
jgi:hydrogenase maturation factor